MPLDMKNKEDLEKVLRCPQCDYIDNRPECCLSNWLKSSKEDKRKSPFKFAGSTSINFICHNCYLIRYFSAEPLLDGEQQNEIG
jgi:hypothetical protein